MKKSEQRLAGCRVLLTRPRERTAELIFLLEDEGAEVSCLPLLEFQPPADPRALNAAAERISRYDWIIFASPNAVAALAEAARVAGTEAQLRRARSATIGPSTTRAARAVRLNVVVEAAQNTSAGLFEALKGHLLAGEEILIPAAQDGRRELEQSLRDHGFSATRIAAYQTAKSLPPEDDWNKAIGARPEAIVFASPRTAEAFAALPRAQEVAKAAMLIAIGPTTAEALHRLSMPADATADRPTAEGLVEAVVLARAAKRGKEGAIEDGQFSPCGDRD